MPFTNPICFFDLETTGTDTSKDRIVDISITKIKNFNSEQETSETITYLVNPGIPIPNADIHGITDEMVKDAPPFKLIAEEISDFIKGCDLSGYNAKKFDIPLLAQELDRCNIIFSLDGIKVFDPFILYKILNPQSLSAAYKRYTGNDLEEAHRAANDTSAAITVLRGMINGADVPEAPDELIKFQQKGEEFDPTVDFAGKFIRNKEGVIIFNLGQHRNKPVMDHLDFVDWMMGKEFTNDTLRWCQKFLEDGFFNRSKLDWHEK